VTTEANLHFELYRHLINAISQCAEYHGVRYGEVIPEKIVDSGRADIVVQDDRGRSILIIEAKREDGGKHNRDIDPY
jgi:RecB family endonuclease NucS